MNTSHIFPPTCCARSSPTAGSMRAGKICSGLNSTAADVLCNECVASSSSKRDLLGCQSWSVSDIICRRVCLLYPVWLLLCVTDSPLGSEEAPLPLLPHLEQSRVFISNEIHIPPCAKQYFVGWLHGKRSSTVYTPCMHKFKELDREGDCA